jgi:hypothetical protein
MQTKCLRLLPGRTLTWVNSGARSTGKGREVRNSVHFMRFRLSLSFSGYLWPVAWFVKQRRVVFTGSRLLIVSSPLDLSGG